MLYIETTLLHVDACWLHLSFDGSVPLPILYLLTKNKQNLNVGKLTKKVFFHHCAIKNIDYHDHLEFAKKGFGQVLVCKVFQCNNLLSGSIHIEFHHSIFLPVVERLSFFSKSKRTQRRLRWPNLARSTTQLILKTSIRTPNIFGISDISFP